MVHVNSSIYPKKRALMIRYNQPKQLTLSEFDWPFHTALDENNRWVRLGQCIPWEALADAYYQGFSDSHGRPAKDARLVIGAVIIKHKLCLSDRETVAQIQENPYLQYFVGLPGYQMKAPFAASLLVDVRKRMGDSVFEVFHSTIINSIEQAKSSKKAQTKSKSEESSDNSEDPPPPSDTGCTEPSRPHQGKLILDATVAPQAIRYPTDLSLLNEARAFSETIIDRLYQPQKGLLKKPRTYRIKARQDYLQIAKLKRPSAKVRRRGVKQQLQYLRRNLKHIEQLLTFFPVGRPLPLPRWLLYRYWVIQHLYEQQAQMYRSRTQRCDNRIVSISQPYVRPIVRGKLNTPVEFGAKLSVSLNPEGIACVDHLRWDSFHEGLDLPNQVERFRTRYGVYPESVLADPLYGTQANRSYLKSKGIRFAGKPLGRPRKITPENQAELKQLKIQQREEYRQRIPIEGKFGQGKSGYRLNYIRAKRADTSSAWINSIFLVMNLQILLRIFFVLNKRHLVPLVSAILVIKKWVTYRVACGKLGINRHKMFSYRRIATL